MQDKKIPYQKTQISQNVIRLLAQKCALIHGLISNKKEEQLHIGKRLCYIHHWDICKKIYLKIKSTDPRGHVRETPIRTLKYEMFQDGFCIVYGF